MTSAPKDMGGNREFDRARVRAAGDIEQDAAVPSVLDKAAVLSTGRDWMAIATLVAMVILAVSLFNSTRATTNAQHEASAAEARATRFEQQLRDQGAENVCRVRFANADASLASVSDISFNKALVSNANKDADFLVRFTAWSELLRAARDRAAQERTASTSVCAANPDAVPTAVNLPPVPS